MENSKTKKACPGNTVQATRLDRATAKMERLQAELSQVRARCREEAARQERIDKLRERERIANEQRFLGRLCRIAGVGNFREEGGASSVEAEGRLDANLIVGGLRLLADQMSQFSGDDCHRLRQSGAELMTAVEGKKSATKSAQSSESHDGQGN